MGPIYRPRVIRAVAASAHRSSCRRRSEEPPRTVRIRGRHTTAALSAVQAHRGTEGSNPLPSSGESANFRSLSGSVGDQPYGLTVPGLGHSADRAEVLADGIFCQIVATS